MLVPRGYQQTLVSKVVQSLTDGLDPLLQASTGAGKTVMATLLTEWALARGWTVFFVCHRRELLLQTSQTFTAGEVAHSFIAAKRPHDPAARVFVCSVDTLKSRFAKLTTRPQLVLWDECHHLGAEGWAKLQAYYGDARHIGLSATPQASSGVGMDRFFDVLHEGPQTAWLIEEGALARYRYFAPSMPELESIGVRGGDYKVEDARKVMTKELTGDAIHHYQKNALDLTAAAFCVDVEHSKATAAQFNAAGIPSAHVDGDTPDDERDDIIRRFADGEIKVLCNVNLLGEGFDLGAIAGKPVTIDCVILLRPTKSLKWYIQMVGRVLRVRPGKVGIINDHAGCAREHGLPCDVRHWHLDGRVTGPKDGDTDGPLPAAPATCLGCFSQIARPLKSPLCPYCGGQLVEPKPLPKSNDKELRELRAAEMAALRAAKAQARVDAEIAKDLLEIERIARQATKEAERAERQAAEIVRKRELEQQRQREKEEDWSCTSVAELAQLGKRRGYAHPHHWATRRWPFVEAKRKRYTTA